MYKTFFALHANPFNDNPDPRYLFCTRHTDEALSCLIYGVEKKRGFVLLTGEVGTGKTTLVHKLLERLHQNDISTALVFNPRMDVPQFLNYVVTDFGILVNSRSKDEVLRSFNEWLLHRYHSGQGAALIVDEAQQLSDEVLEEIRLLTNLETSTEKLLQVVLIGQPELEDKLKQPHLRQLRQRVTLWARTRPLTSDETSRYVAARLRVAGSNNEEAIFDSGALISIHRFSGGIPRLINLICEHCLVAAFADQNKTITREVVEIVAQGFDLRDSTPPAPRNIAAARESPFLEKFEGVNALRA